MSIVIPFKGVLYNPEKISDISRVVAPPYDMISPEEQKILHDRDPFNFVRLSLGYQYPGDDGQNNRYSRTAKTLKKWLAEGILEKDEKPSIYVYDQAYARSTGERLCRRGFIALSRLEEFGEGRIFPHERTLSGPKEDRLKLTLACRAYFSQIFSFYSDPEGRAERAIGKKLPSQPRYDFSDEKDVKHTIYSIADEGVIEQVVQSMTGQRLFIADGHHRYETALNFRRIMKEHLGEDCPTSYDYVMMYFSNTFSPGLTILPFHRLIRLPDFISAEKVVKRLRYVGELIEMPQREEVQKAFNELAAEMAGADGSEHRFGIYFPPRTFLLKYRRGSAIQPVAGEIMDDLDVNILHRFILEEVLEGAASQVEISYIKEEKDIEKRMKKGEYHLAFFLNPTRVEQVREIASAGLRMPPKSTNFHPKLISGLLMNLLDD